MRSKVNYLVLITQLQRVIKKEKTGNKVKNEIANITNLGTTTALTTVENKILNVSNLV